MTAEPRKTRSRIDGDGVKVVEVAGVRRGVWLIGLALLLAAAAVVLALRLALREEAPEAASAEAPAAVAAAPSAPPAPKPVTAPRAHPVRRVAAPHPPPPAPSAGEVPPEVAPLPEFPDEPGNVASGIALFPPLGTEPLKQGILVPEDFELPEGYVRHFQATDDGQGLPAILMFHPDYEWLDANGDPIPLPEDRIVPPELAPPGMPIVPIDLPPSQAESDPVP
ncbi:MAG TPA: hypothetical protein VII72_04790 [Myxococcota bacterium]